MSARNPCILLVEDSEDDVILFRRALSRTGISLECHWVADGEQAIRFFKGIARGEAGSFVPGLVLLDIKLPYRNGFEVLDWIRREMAAPRLPVIMLTSSNDPSDRRRAQALGADRYLVKPSCIDDLSDIIRALHAEWLVEVPGAAR